MSFIKPQKAGCTMLVNLSRDEPSRVWMINACKCNLAADMKFPGICDMVCPLSALDQDGCECKNELYAGETCNEKKCKLGGNTYCIPQFSGTPKRCDKNYKPGPFYGLPDCPCRSGTVVGDRCQCNENYHGTFCEEYLPPPPPPATPRSKTYNNHGINVILPISVVVGVVVVVVICALICRKRRSYAAGYRAQTPIPGSTVPGSTVPVAGPFPSAPPPYVEAVDTGAVPLAQPYPYPQPPSAAPGYNSANPSAITTTYTFTPLAAKTTDPGP